MSRLIFAGGIHNFYPRPRVEGDYEKIDGDGGVKNFYPRPRVEGDPQLP